MREEGRRSEVSVTQSGPGLCDPVDCSQLSSSVHGIFLARILEWIAIPFSGGSSQLRDRTWVSCIAGRFFTVWAPREALKGKVVVQLPSRVWLFANPWTPLATRQASLSLTIFQSSPKLMSIALMMPSSYLILWHPLLLLPSIFPSTKVFSNESTVRIRWPKCWSFSFSISPFNEYSGLISLKIDWFCLLAVQGTHRSLLQHHSSVLWCSAFFMVQLSQQYVTGGKTKALTIQTFVSRVMSLLFNILSRFVTAFLPRSNRLLISRLQSPSTVILEPEKRKSATTSTFSPSICHEVMGPDAIFFNI